MFQSAEAPRHRRRQTRRQGLGRHPHSFTVAVTLVEPHFTTLNVNQIARKRELALANGKKKVP